MAHLPRIRERKEVGPVLKSLPHYRCFVWGETAFVNTWPLVNLNAVNFSHDRCADMTHPGPPYRCGGPLDVWHKAQSAYQLTSFDSYVNWNSNMQAWQYRYTGDYFVKEGVLNASNPVGWMSSWGDGSAYGPTGWNRYKPGRPASGFGQSLAELRDLPRMLRQLRSKVNSLRSIGESYLSYEFGWAPLFRDIVKTFDIMGDLQRRYDFLRRNNGKWDRRGGPVASSSEQEVVSYESAAFWAPSTFNGACHPVGFTPSYELRTSWQTEVWFEAAFKFWLPDLGTNLGFVETLKTLGMLPTPALVWELIPWSWLIDWFTNLGDVISNISPDSAPNLTAKYAYIMCHTKVTQEYQSKNLAYYRGSEIVRPSLKFSRSWERKQRVAASPFGFGLTWDGLNPSQLAILAALGITRV